MNKKKKKKKKSIAYVTLPSAKGRDFVEAFGNLTMSYG
jgi:hypothetical protein